MTNAEVEIDSIYLAKVSGKVVRVQIMHKLRLGRGWSARNLETNNRVFIRSGRRLRAKV